MIEYQTSQGKVFVKASEVFAISQIKTKTNLAVIHTIHWPDGLEVLGSWDSVVDQYKQGYLLEAQMGQEFEVDFTWEGEEEDEEECDEEDTDVTE